MDLGDPLQMVFREFQARFPVGLRQLEIMTQEEYETFVRDKIIVTVRAKVLAHQLAPAVIRHQESRFERREVTVEKTIERPWRRIDCLRLALGWSAHRVEWVTARYHDVIEVVVPIDCDHETVIDREVHFPESTITYPEMLGRAVYWEEEQPR